MKVVIATLPITGRANPALNVGSILVKAGHEVVFTSAEGFRVAAETRGLKFIPSTASAEEMLDLTSRFPERNKIPVGPERSFSTSKMSSVMLCLCSIKGCFRFSTHILRT